MKCSRHVVQVLALASTLLALFASTLAQAQSGGTYDLSHDVIAGGGGTAISGNGFMHGGTIGQWHGAQSSGSTYTMLSGFWADNALQVQTTLTDAVGATDTTIPVADISAFPDLGTIQIDDEIIQYRGKASSDAAATALGALATVAQSGVFLNLTRGADGTIAAAHPAGSTVTLIPLRCSGDCDGSGNVTIGELITLVNVALGSAEVSTCPAGDVNHDDRVTIDELVQAVNKALNGCGSSLR